MGRYVVSMDFAQWNGLPSWGFLTMLIVIWAIISGTVSGFRQDVIISSIPVNTSDTLTDLHLVSLHSFTGDTWPAGNATFAAAKMALEDIGRRRDILPGYRIVMTAADSKCEPGRGINGVMKQLMKEPVKLMVAGIPCSNTAEALASALNEWNTVSMSPSAQSVVLSDRKAFPLFFRTTASDLTIIPARLQLMKEFGWTKFASVRGTDRLFSTISDEMIKSAKEENMTVITSEVIADGDSSLQASALKAMDARVIFINALEPNGVNFLCELYQQGHYGPHISFTTLWWWEDRWIHSAEDVPAQCTAEDLLKVMNYAFYIGPTLGNSDGALETISGKTNAQFDAEFLGNFDGAWPYGSGYRESSYDLIWAVALALNSTFNKLQATGSTKRLENFTYEDSEIAGMITASLYNDVQFQGMTGLVDFDETGSIFKNYKIEQRQGHERNLVGYYMAATQEIHWIGSGPIWQNGKVPVDSVSTVLVGKHVSNGLYIAMSIWASIGILQAMFFFAFNLVYRNKRMIKMSSPKINALILSGCVLCYSSNLLADVEDSKISLLAICIGRLFVFILGFSLAFGSLFAKTWRVHAILTTKSPKHVIISDARLSVIVLVLVTINASILVAWQLYDPYKIIKTQLTQLEVTGETDDILLIPEISSCVSQYNMYFSGALCVVQGITMVFGAFLAWETRQVKLQALNDSKLIAICIYNVAVLSILGGIILFVIEDDLDLSYGFSSGLIICGTMITSNIIFVPKIVALNRGEDGAVGTVLDNTIHSPKEQTTVQKLIMTVDQWTQTY